MTSASLGVVLVTALLRLEADEARLSFDPTAAGSTDAEAAMLSRKNNTSLVNWVELVNIRTVEPELKFCLILNYLFVNSSTRTSS